MKPQVPVCSFSALCTQANNSAIILTPTHKSGRFSNKIPWSYLFSSLNSLTLHFLCDANPFVSLCLYPRRLDNDSEVLYQVASCTFAGRRQHFFFLSFTELVFRSQLDFANYCCFKRKQHVGWKSFRKVTHKQ